MVNMQPTIESLRELNSRLVLQIDELRKKFTEVETKNIKLKQSFEEFALKDKATKLEQIQTHNDNKKHIAKLDDDIKKIKQISTLVPEEQYSANINASCEMNSEGNLKQIDSQYGNTSASDITDNTSNSNEPDSAFLNISKNVSDTTSNPDVYKKNSNEIREGNQKKKLQSQGSVQNTSDIQNEVNPVIDQEQNTKVKISYNKRVEQDLRCDLSLFIKDNNNKVSEVFDIQIPEFSLEVIVTGSSKITVQNIADLFIIAMKVRQKEILCWYYYYKAYKDRVENIKRINKIDDQSARTLVYNKIKALLLDISDIQDIINCFPKNSNVDDSSIKYQEMISGTNCNVHVTKPSSSKDVSNIECSDGNDDYYRITNNTLCPLCRLDHGDDDIEGEYKNGTYYIKCERRIVQITA
ncbi:hypothetical protein C2G38_2222000 [Gigaspora rosea]|uniref:Uncharacterized protein n=1 Tax=Gigaspora rosea TaxID=44941 RepID=A0A397U6A9_9GLOM|nr:hypothetical protein C2G38_2222000 [Gigaspora rosea]